MTKNMEIIERMINMCYFCCLDMERSKMDKKITDAASYSFFLQKR